MIYTRIIAKNTTDSPVLTWPFGTVVEGSFWLKDLKDGEFLQFTGSAVEQVTFRRVLGLKRHV